MQFEFVAGRPVLDFVATVASRDTDRVERLQAPTDLAAWVVQAGLVDRAPQVGADDLARATTVREAMFRLVTALTDGRPADPADRARVNAVAAGAPPVPRLTDEGLHRTGDVDAALAALARDCLDLYGSEDRASLRWCADETCTRPFIDRSRGQRRRWCGMKSCGDRAKAAAYRQRRRATPP